ncbi:MAG: hypothetical protein ABEH90_09360 [Halolamina sp.]
MSRRPDDPERSRVESVLYPLFFDDAWNAVLLYLSAVVLGAGSIVWFSLTTGEVTRVQLSMLLLSGAILFYLSLTHGASRASDRS